MDLAQMAEQLDERVRNHPIVCEWKAPVIEGTTWNEPWMTLEVDPVSILYSTRDLSLGVSIHSKSAQARVTIVWAWRSWREGITDVHLTYALERATQLVEYLWNNHFFTPENAYASTVITMDL